MAGPPRDMWTGSQIAVLIILLVVTNAVTASTFFFMGPTNNQGPEILPPPEGPRIIFTETELEVSFDYRGQSAVLDSYRHLRILEDRFEKEWILGPTFRENRVEVVIELGRGTFALTIMTDGVETRITNDHGDITVYVRHGDELIVVLEIDNFGHNPPVTDLSMLIRDNNYRAADGISFRATGCDAFGACKVFSGRL